MLEIYEGNIICYNEPTRGIFFKFKIIFNNNNYHIILRLYPSITRLHDGWLLILVFDDILNRREQLNLFELLKQLFFVTDEMEIERFHDNGFMKVKVTQLDLPIFENVFTNFDEYLNVYNLQNFFQY